MCLTKNYFVYAFGYFLITSWQLEQIKNFILIIKRMNSFKVEFCFFIFVQVTLTEIYKNILYTRFFVSNFKLIIHCIKKLEIENCIRAVYVC